VEHEIAAMHDYNAPLKDMRFALNEIAGIEALADLPGYEEVSPDLVDAVLEEAGKLANGVIGPLNRPGDQAGAKIDGGVVTTAPGFKDAYQQFVEGGWNSLPFNPDFGGQGLPWTLNVAVAEMWASSNTAFNLCPMLTVGAIEAISSHGTNDQQLRYLPKLVSGEWTGTMNLTEPQAGSDVGALRTKAWREDDHWRIDGQKIFITYGDHDYTENIIHLVLARTEGAPEGVKGISLFLVPKVLVNDDGSLGEPNDLRAVSLEHKLGIHASPTCVMEFGGNEGAVGYLIGEEFDGMACMFTMMNNARLNVGLAGLGTGERAFQQAVTYAKERVQGRDIATGEQGVAIINHPDVRRMLLGMKAQTEAMRALIYYVASRMDLSKRHADESLRKQARAVLDLLIPITKSWCTDLACDVAHTGVQVHGGMGFIEETGAAQHSRDARIHPIYEGTNGIQANDLMGRKVLRDGGEAARGFVAEMRQTLEPLGQSNDADLVSIRGRLEESLDCLDKATDWLVETGRENVALASAASVPYLNLFGNTTGGWLLARSAVSADNQRASANGDAAFLEAKIKTARFFADHMMTQASGLLDAITDGSAAVLAVAEDQF
jgi:alkylation response protein AidB-like acyl-CoA dehydrogenase